jgi:transposase-like protein
METNKRTHLDKSEVIQEMPAICSNELAAVEFFERQLWGGKPHCAHCHSASVYQMKDAKTGQRNKAYLWRCHECKKQFTVRIGTVLEESRIPLKHWAYAFWRMATSKKGVAALEIQRHCQISYPSALFLLHRIRSAMTPDSGPKLKGVVEADETYVGGKPRPGDGKVHKRGRGTKKSPVFAIVERDGSIRRSVVPNVSGRTLKSALQECVDPSARIITDELSAYNGLHNLFRGGHDVVQHSIGEYARGDVNTNTAESSFAILKRGITGIYHAVSKKHLHRYVGEFDFRWNTRRLNDGERTMEAIRGASGKRLSYRNLVSTSEPPSDTNANVVKAKKRQIRRVYVLKHPVRNYKRTA